MPSMKKKTVGNPRRSTHVYPKDNRFKPRTRTSGFDRKLNPVGREVKGKRITSTIRQTVYLDKYGHIRRRTVRKIK